VRVPRVRFTVRRAMLVVAGLALALWVLAPAIKIMNDPGRGRLIHLWQRPDGVYLFSSHEVGFWARYRRGLLGLPWDCPFAMCKENEAVCREIDSGGSVDVMIRDHPVVLMSPSSPK
jgi:hypothetical protein